MGLKSLQLSQFRNLHSVNIETNAELILITGDNAAGKTSLLESIFYLSYGRSFRQHSPRHLIQQGFPFFRVIVQLDNDSRIGIERSSTEQSIRFNNQSVRKLSELSAEFPVLALHPDSHQLISAGPDNRRQFIDWGVFHVEQRFLGIWKDYKTALSQRNAALRSSQADRLCSLWDKQLVASAEQIETMRLAYIEHLIPAIDELSQSLFPGKKIEISYYRGIPRGVAYADYLRDHLASDRMKGFTQSGPHRADLKILVDGQSAQTSVSRGQQKLLVCLLKIAQLVLFSQDTQQRCVFLFDDLPAELDTENQNKVLSLLSGLDVQVFVSAIDAQQINRTYWESSRMFHVEQGVVKAC